MILSLRARLTLVIVLVIGPCLAALVSVLYFTAYAAIWADFDSEVEATARIFANLVEWDAEDGYELEGGEEIASMLRAEVDPTHVEVRAQGRVLLGAGGRDVPTWELGRIVEMDDGRRGLRLRAAPRTDVDLPAPGVVDVLVVRETAATRASLERLAAWFWLLGASALVLAAIAVSIAVVRGMAPVQTLARRMDRIKEPDDAFELPRSAVPHELRPVVDRLGALLDRLRTSFVRERRFVADVAHELRTPLAVLRGGVDLALQRTREPTALETHLRELRATVERMTTMVENLLLLSRADGGQLRLDPTSIPLALLVDECWVPFAAVAARRGLTYTRRLDDDVTFVADEAALRMIVTNLLANAVEYAEPGAAIEVIAPPRNDGILAVIDSGPSIPEMQLPHLFEPFWRADGARSEAGIHCGIGLPLARALARCQGCDVILENMPEGGVAATLVRVAETPRRDGADPADDA